MARGGTSTVRGPLPRFAISADAPRRGLLAAAAATCAVLCALSLAAAGLVLAVVGYEALATRVRGNTDDAARWATLLFAAGAPVALAYGTHLGYRGAVARLRGGQAMGGAVARLHGE